MISRLIFYRALGRDHFKRRVVVLGAGPSALAIADLARQPHTSAFRCLGFLPVEGEEKLIAADQLYALPEVMAAVERDQLDEIVIAVEDRRGRLPLEDLVDCRLSGVMVSDYQSFCERERGHIDLDSLTPSWFFFRGGFRNSRLQLATKRLVDILGASLLLLFFSPVMVLIALILKLEGALTRSGGPVIYRQERVGEKGRLFVINKFRSMRPDAEAGGQPRWAEAGDARVTRIGAFLRKTRMDELPQLFNILKGEMSIVGPRPERPYFVDLLKSQLPYYNERHRMKPGVTGWAQVNFDYAGSLEDSKIKLEHDLYYIKHYSLFLDLIIILQTIRVVLWSEGAR